MVAVDVVTIANEKTWCFFVRESVDDLLGGPFGVGIRGNVEVNDLPPVVTEHDEDVEDTESHGGNGEEVAGGDVGNVIVQKRPPRLRRRFPSADHVLGHGPFGDVVAQQGNGLTNYASGTSVKYTPSSRRTACKWARSSSAMSTFFCNASAAAVPTPCPITMQCD